MVRSPIRVQPQSEVEPAAKQVKRVFSSWSLHCAGQSLFLHGVALRRRRPGRLRWCSWTPSTRFSFLSLVSNDSSPFPAAAAPPPPPCFYVKVINVISLLIFNFSILDTQKSSSPLCCSSTTTTASSCTPILQLAERINK